MTLHCCSFSFLLIAKLLQSYNGNKKISFPYFPFKKKLKSSQNGNAEALLLELELESSDFLISLSSAKRPLSVSFPFSTLLNCFSQRNIEQIGTDCDLFTKEFEMKTFSSPKQNIRPGPSLKSLEGVEVEEICIHWRTRVVALGEREMTSCARFFRS